jgi:hypothetical protein
MHQIGPMCGWVVWLAAVYVICNLMSCQCMCGLKLQGWQMLALQCIGSLAAVQSIICLRHVGEQYV